MTIAFAFPGVRSSIAWMSAIVSGERARPLLADLRSVVMSTSTMFTSRSFHSREADGCYHRACYEMYLLRIGSTDRAKVSRARRIPLGEPVLPPPIMPLRLPRPEIRSRPATRLAPGVRPQAHPELLACLADGAGHPSPRPSPSSGEGVKTTRQCSLIGADQRCKTILDTVL